MNPTITEDQRGALDATLRTIKEARDAIEGLIAPHAKALMALAELKATAEQAAGVTVIGRCEGCDGLLVAGDLGHTGTEGLDLCESCSPTWADLLKQYEEAGPVDDSDREALQERQHGIYLCRSKVAEGQGDAKHVWELG